MGSTVSAAYPGSSPDAAASAPPFLGAAEASALARRWRYARKATARTHASRTRVGNTGVPATNSKPPRAAPTSTRVFGNEVIWLSTSVLRFASEAERVTMMPGAHRDHQRRHLRDDAVADGQQRVALQRLAPGHAVLHHADDEPADDVDQHDDDAGDRVALDELAGAVHRAVEARLLLQVLAPTLRLRLIDEPHVEVGVDAHLLAGHAVEREPRRDLGDALRAAGDDDVLHDDQDQEDDQPDHVVAADHERADRRDHLAGVARPRG